MSSLYSSQIGNKVVDEWTVLPEVVNAYETLEFSQAKVVTSPIRIVGAGVCGVANGHDYNGMIENPALLSRERKELISVAIRGEVTTPTFNTIGFLTDNDNSLLNSTFGNTLWEGVEGYLTAETAEERVRSVEKVNSLFADIDEFVDNIVGYPDPVLYGVSLVPRISAQWKRFGLTVTAEGRAFIMAHPGDIVLGLAKTKLETDANGYLEPISDEQLWAMRNRFLDKDGNIRASALPRLFALGFRDLTVSAGYAHPIGEHFAIGGNLNFISRQFKTGVLSAHNYIYALQESYEMINASQNNYILSFDLGGLYENKERKLSVGASLQNLIPLLVLEDTITVFTSKDSIHYHTDENGDYELTPEGDTVVDYATQKITNTVPIKIELPFTATIGANWEMTDFLSVSAEWKDIFANDHGSFEYYADRFAVGAELDFRDFLFLRGGLATHRPTLGGGIHSVILKKFHVGMDVAYAYDNFGREMGLFVELGLNFRL